jgi:hypothetical protein
VREEVLSAIESDPWLTSGPATLTNLDLMRRTVVQVNDHYFDAARIDPARMLDAMVQTLENRSEGFVRAESDHLLTAAGDRWKIPIPKTIWEVPVAIRDLGYFLLEKLPPGHPLAKGPFAEVVMTNALLGTLDSYSILLSPKVWPGLQQPTSVDTAATRSGPPANGRSSSGNPPVPLEAGAILVIRAGRLGSRSAEQIRGAVERASAAGASGLVLDLRGNVGGLLEATLDVADLFLSKGTLVTTNGKASAEETSAADDGLASERLKLIVLVDSATSSGAEILAGALRFGDRALLLGENTAGNGLIQVLYEFKNPDSSIPGGLKLTIAEALLPGDRSFQGLGIAPDLEVSTKTRDRGASARACAPLGETLAAVRYEHGEPDPVLALAQRILKTSATASRVDLLAAAKAAAALSAK